MASIVAINAEVSCCGLMVTRLPHHIRAKLVVALWKMFENKTIMPIYHSASDCTHTHTDKRLCTAITLLLKQRMALGISNKQLIAIII